MAPAVAFSRQHLSEIGIEDNRRASSGEQYLMTTSAALSPRYSRQWKWQRSPT